MLTIHCYRCGKPIRPTFTARVRYWFSRLTRRDADHVWACEECIEQLLIWDRIREGRSEE